VAAERLDDVLSVGAQGFSPAKKAGNSERFSPRMLLLAAKARFQ